MHSKPFIKKIRIFLFPFAWLYGIAVSFRNFCFNHNIIRSYEFDIPVISVGNITVGGTGKTPHVEYLIRLLKDDYKTAVLSRGYKRKTKGHILGDQKSTPRDIGDEPYQLLKKFAGISVAVNEKRVDGINRLRSEIKELRTILLDDAFQHRYVKPGLSVLLIDYSRPVFHDFLLPAGDLRENQSAIKRANIVVVTKTPDDIKPIEKRIWKKKLHLYPYQYFFFSTIEYEKPVPVFSGESRSGSQAINQSITDVLLVTGIVNPSGLAEYLNNKKLKIHHLKFPDHHNFSQADIEKISQLYFNLPEDKTLFITTEKDAARFRFMKNFPKELKENFYYLPIRIKFLDNKQKEFNELIIRFVETNKKVSRLSG